MQKFFNMQPFEDNTSNIPAFLGKLWKMVNDSNTDHLICWSPAGNSFIIQNQAQFWYELLPLYYKHNNMSSFVRQLNMYGFHKMSTVENGTMDADKDEIQFYHRYFQIDHPELLCNIKRKVTVSKSENNVKNVIKHDDIEKVLTDVKQLRGRQTSVDSQLTAMKQENAVLWRELAMLRQKHMKQQQIVNKLIQFLVTVVQPTPSSRMGVGVKRRIPLMLHESPIIKKCKTKKTFKRNSVDNGPTIHELDSEIDMTPGELFEEVEESSTETNELPPESPIETNSMREENFTDLEINQNNEKIFLNPNTRDILLTNLVNGSYNTNALSGKSGKRIFSELTEQPNSNFISNASAISNSDMTIATRDMKINNITLGTNDCSRDDLDSHLDNAQGEIDHLKDILHGCGTLDANTLIGLFNDDAPSYGINFIQHEHNKDNLSTTGDPMVSGTELVTCGNNLIDFNELFDDTLDGQYTDSTNEEQSEMSSTVNTPMIIKTEPSFSYLDKDV